LEGGEKTLGVWLWVEDVVACDSCGEESCEVCLFQRNGETLASFSCDNSLFLSFGGEGCDNGEDFFVADSKTIMECFIELMVECYTFVNLLFVNEVLFDDLIFRWS